MIIKRLDGERMKKEAIPVPRIPVSTYRLQFNHTFKFSDAKKIIPYLHELGITDIYASPLFKARKGGLHGYDIIDPNALNPEVGTEKDYDEFAHELKQHGMGLVLDIVPNHMCNESGNFWWMDVLENGQGSLYANFFDIDWSPAEKKLAGKILIPFLGEQYGKALEKQELKLSFEQGAFFVSYYENKFPILPDTYISILQHRVEDLQSSLSADNPHFTELLNIITALTHLPAHTEKDREKINERYREKEIIKKRLFTLYNERLEIKNFIDENIRIFNGVQGEPMSFNLLDRLLGEQVWRLSHWRVATEEVNYRRFFDINNIAAIRMQEPEVFSEVHKLIFKLIAGEKITGLRVDHLDGLYNPSEYFKRLQRGCFIRSLIASVENLKDDIPPDNEQSDTESQTALQYDDVLLSDPQFKPFYIIGEKILTKGEKMPEDWPVFGTTGYVFLNSLNNIFVDTRNAKAFDGIYSSFIKAKLNFPDIVYEKKKLVMQAVMSGEISTLGHYLDNISEKNRHTRDFTLLSLTRAITEVIAFFPVYRTYIDSKDVKERDRQYIELAVSKAKRKNPAINASVFDFLRDVLLLRFPEDIDETGRGEWLDFVMRFQQITAPVMAKGLEDTVFYVYNRLVSLNEVGGSPERFGTSPEAFHGQNIERIKYWPHALITTSTHDVKRSEDVRARINVLSEVPEKWKECLIRWSALNKKKKPVVEGQPAPDRNEEYLLYQTFIGAWPVSFIDNADRTIFKNRIKDYMLKAIREAKVNTSWISPNTAYEEALMSFIDAVMTDSADNKFLKEFGPFQKMISRYGIFNSLSQTLLKIASPGVPDFYQGTEVWDFSLVDPDNRRPVDYQMRIKLLDELKKTGAEIGQLALSGKLSADKDGGQAKLYLIYKALNYRRENRELFESGEYVPLETRGEKNDNVCAFARRYGDSTVLIAAPRFFTKLIRQPDGLPFGKEVWEDSLIVIPSGEEGAGYRNIFTGETVTAKNIDGAAALYLSEVFVTFPVALMEKIK